MKITLHKIHKVKMALPQEDRDQIDKELAEGGLKPETMSRVAKFYHNFLSCKRQTKVKGAFGKRGGNRKMQIIEKQRGLLNRIKEQ